MGMHIHDDKISAFIVTPKPDWCKPSDVAVMVYLMTEADGSGNCSPTQDEMAQAVGLGDGKFGLRSSLERLDQNGWIKYHKEKTIGVRHSYKVNFKSIPQHASVNVGKEVNK